MHPRYDSTIHPKARIVGHIKESIHFGRRNERRISSIPFDIVHETIHGEVEDMVILYDGHCNAIVFDK